MQCRYAGHTKSFYSVAEHSVHISNAVPPEAALWGLLHDAPECYLVDLPSPVKQGIPEYRRYERRLMSVIAERFGLPMPEPPIVKEYDHRILHNERRDLMRHGILDWYLVGEPIPDLEIQAWTPAEGYDRFMSRFLQLTGDQVALS